ncbi:MAG: iron chaperone [Spirochaetales bacterium]
MEIFKDYVNSIENKDNRQKFEGVLEWVQKTFPRLTPRFAWGQPMFTLNGTFIIGFSVAKPHFAFAPEELAVNVFSSEITKAGYDHGTKFARIKWSAPVNYALLKKIIEFNMIDKANCKTFWRK